MVPGATTVERRRMLGFPDGEADLLDVPPSISEPVVELTLRHVGIAGQVVLLGLRGVRVLVMRLQPLDKHGMVALGFLRFCRGHVH